MRSTSTAALAIVAIISLFSQHRLLPNPTLEFTLFVVLEGDSRGDNHSETTVYQVCGSLTDRYKEPLQTLQLRWLRREV